MLGPVVTVAGEPCLVVPPCIRWGALVTGRPEADCKRPGAACSPSMSVEPGSWRVPCCKIGKQPHFKSTQYFFNYGVF